MKRPKEGTQCEVFSLSQNKWIKGVVSKRLKRGYVRVQYGDDLEKDIHFEHEHLRLESGHTGGNNSHSEGANKENQKGTRRSSRSTTNTGNVTVGQRCQVFSRSQNQWFDGKVVKKLKGDDVRVQFGDGLEKDMDVNDVANLKLL